MSLSAPSYRLNRRSVVGALTAFGLVTFSGCKNLQQNENESAKKVEPTVPPEPSLKAKQCWEGESGRVLNIDAHCHIFNGDDLPVKTFIDQVAVHTNGYAWLDPRSWPGRFLQGLSNISSPTAQKELLLLNGYLPFKNGLKDLCNHYHDGVMTPAKPEDVTLTDWASGVPKYVAPLRKEQGFLTYPTSYRLYNALALMEKFPQVHLFTPALVDFDASIGGDTPVALKLQMDIMEGISVLTRGRFHAYAPFDPARQVEYIRKNYGRICDEVVQRDEYDINKTPKPDSPFGLIKNAIEQQGFIGIKVYPPVGFKAVGNKKLNNCRAFKKRKEALDHYDAILEQLYTWCAINDVPILAHANDSNHASAHSPQSLDGNEDPLCGNLGSIDEWQEVLTKSRKNKEGKDIKLKVSLGHLSRLDSHIETIKDLAKFKGIAYPSGQLWMDLTEKATKQKQEFKDLGELFADAKISTAYGDFANYTAIKDDPIRFSNYLQQLLKAAPVASQRIMYGSDWYMSSAAQEPQAGKNPYWEAHQAFASHLSETQKGFSANYFGVTAANFLGLKKGQENRCRLEAFYKKWRIDIANVPWMSLVDESSVT